MNQNTGRLLKKAANQLTKNFDYFARQYGLTSNQMSIIDYLSRHGDIVVLQKDIENEFNIQRSTATVLLQRMERKQLISRQPMASDARQKAIQLTNKTAPLVAKIDAYMQTQQLALAHHFSPAELAIFETILNYYLNNHETERPSNAN